MKTLFVLLTLPFAAGCATLPPKAPVKEAPAPVLSSLDLKKQKVHDCTLNLIDREINAVEAEKVCTNIWRKRR